MNYINKTKKYFIDSLKFIGFICFLKGIQDFWAGLFVDISDIFNLHPYLCDLSTFIIVIYLRTVFHFFVAKKSGIILFLDKKPLLISLAVTYLIDYFVVYCRPIYDTLDRYWMYSTFADANIHIIIGVGFTSLYLVYKLAKFLIKKFPKKFLWIDKLYPRFLDKLSNTKALFLILLVCAYKLQSFVKIRKSLPQHFYHSFLYIAIAIFIIFFIYSFIQDAIQFFKSKKHIAIKNKIEELYNKTYLRVKNKETTFPALVKEILSYEIKIKKK